MFMLKSDMNRYRNGDLKMAKQEEERKQEKGSEWLMRMIVKYDDDSQQMKEIFN